MRKIGLKRPNKLSLGPKKVSPPIIPGGGGGDLGGQRVSGVYSEAGSNSVGEADKRSEDYIVLKVSRTQTSNYASSCAGTEIHLAVLEISQAKF